MMEEIFINELREKRAPLLKEEASIRKWMVGKSTLTLGWLDQWNRLQEVKYEVQELTIHIHKLELTINR